MIESTSPQLAIARRLVAAGISVIPIGSNKKPATRWKVYQQRHATDAELVDWFGIPDSHGIGVVCGAISGNLEAIDFDVRDFEVLAEVVNCFQNDLIAEDPERKEANTERLLFVRTPGPGVQVLYRCESPVGGNQKLLSRLNASCKKNGREIGSVVIETRGEGGYVLSMGSPGHCHPSGKTYKKLSKGSADLHELMPISAEFRDSLFCIVKGLGAEPPEVVSEPETRVSVHRESTESQIGSEFSSRTSWEEILKPLGFTVAYVSDNVTHWKRPGTKSESSATTNHEGSDLFYSFSPNCGYGIEPERGYSKFAIYTMLNHSGDFTASARALAAQGFGQKDLSHIDISAILRQGEENQPALAENFFGFETFQQFMSVQEEPEYLCQGILVKGESLVIAGPEKSLKTGIGVTDLGYSLATGTPFLGKFNCPRAVTVGVMTGESSRAKFQRQFRNRKEANRLFYIDNQADDPEPRLFITSKLPDLSSQQHMAYIEQSIRRNGLEVLIVDPFYLTLGAMADHTASVAKMGNLLRGLNEVGQSTGCTIVLLHHTNRKHEPGKPLALRDLSGAGLAEWARQWILLSPRQPFDPDRHEHRLWMITGGSSGHAGRYALDVREKDGQGEWSWIVDVRSEGDEKASHHERKAERKQSQQQGKAEEFVRNLREAIRIGEESGGSTVKDLQEVFRKNGWKGIKEINQSKLEEFESAGFVKSLTVKRGDNPHVAIWLAAPGWSNTPADCRVSVSA